MIQKPWALVYREVGKNDMVRWVILHHILNKWVNTWPQWLCYAMGGHFSDWFGSTCPLRGKGKWKSIQSCSEWWTFSYDETFLSWWELSLPWWQCSHEGSLKGLGSMKIMNHINHMLWLLQSADLTTYGRFWTQPLALSTIITTTIKTQNEGISFGQM